jgi:hypothetical protein
MKKENLRNRSNWNEKFLASVKTTSIPTLKGETQKSENLGQIKSLCINKGFGFITSKEFGDVYFITQKSFDNSIMPGDNVIFRLRKSLKHPGKKEAFNVRRCFISADGFIIVDRILECFRGKNKKLLIQALSWIFCNGKEMVQRQVDFNANIGYSSCVSVNKGDKILYAQRKSGMKGLSKFVLDKPTVETKSITIILAKSDGYYFIVDAYFGTNAEPFPWDKNATAESVKFWSNHALIFNKEIVYLNTITKNCPWENHGFFSRLFKVQRAPICIDNNLL